MKSWLNRNVVGFCSASFFGDWCHEMSTAILPMFVAQLIAPSYAPLALGFIQGFSDAVSTVAKLLSGWLSGEVYFYKPFLIVGYGLLAIFLPLIGITQSIFMVLIYKTIAWFGRGLREPMRDTWLASIVSPHYYGHVFGLQRAWDTLGALIGPITTFFLLKMNYSLSSIFLISFIPGIFSVLSIAIITTEEKHTHSKEKTTFLDKMKQLPREFNSFLVIMFIFGCANFNPTLLIYRVQQLLGYEQSIIVATAQGVLLYTFFNIIRALSEFGIGTLSDYVNRRILLALIGFGFFGITTIGFMAQTQALWFWILFFGCAGVSAGTVKVLEKAYASYMLPDHLRGMGLGVLQSIDGIGDLLSSFMVGILWSWGSPIMGLAYATVLSFIAMILLIVKK
jgi:MFS family permease